MRPHTSKAKSFPTAGKPCLVSTKPGAAHLKLIIFVLLAALLVAACGGSDAPPSDTEEAPAAADTATPVTEPDPTDTPEPVPTDTPMPEPTDTPAPEPEATDTPEPEPEAAPAATAQPQEETAAESGAEWGVVARVADGDTLTVRFDNGEEETIGLLDVDTPETVHPNRPEECFGAQASDYTKTLMRQRVRIEPMGRDRYGRLLAYVWTGDGEDGVLWNVRLLEEGLAVYNDYGNPGQYADRTRAAAEKAMLAGVGLWSACEIGERPTVVPAPSVGAGCPQGCVSRPDPACSIKGNVNTSRDTKIYHVEGESPSYGRVNMKEGEGDLWFCTRAEAEANGFRAPRQ